jgi:sulfite dehydrogenase (quinone) subunit SoeA
VAEFDRRGFLKITGAGIGGLLIMDTLGCSDDVMTSDGAVPPPDGGSDGPSPDAGVDMGADAGGDGPVGDGWVTPDDVFKTWPATFTEETIPTTCWIGKQDCGMLATVLTQTVKGKQVKRITALNGNPDHPRNNGALCPKGQAQLQAIYDYNRIKWPLKRSNAKGVPGTFTKITWAAALAELDTQLKDAVTKSKVVLWQKGRSKAKSFYDTAFVNALKGAGVKTAKIGHGTYCSDSGYRAAEYTLGYHGVIGPDIAHTQYILAWGWGMTVAGGNKFCWLTWPQKWVKAKERATNPLKKMVCLDPHRRPTGPHADEWLPNRPGSDVAFFLGLANHLVNNTATGFANGLIDETYLKNHSNAPFFVADDGSFVKVGGKEQVWDTTSSSAKDFDAAGVTPALLPGTKTVGGKSAKTAFERYKAHLATYTPTWADTQTGLPAGTTKKIAGELFTAAKIGSTITLDGKTLPYRPVSMMAYHVSQQETGFQAIRAGINVFQLLGAIDVPGGIQVDFGTKALYKNWPKLDTVSIKTSGLDFTLKDSKFFPINSLCPSFFHKVQLNPAKYDVTAASIPKKVILHMCDPAVAFTDSKAIQAGYKAMEHVTAIQPWLSETADMYADIIMPAATLEKYEGPISCSTSDESATALRVPPVDPLWESKGEIDIYLDIAQKSGFLAGYIGEINKALKLTTNALPTGTKPTSKAIFDAWSKEQGLAGVSFFETYSKSGTKGVTPVSKRTADKKYSGAQNYHGARHRLYGASLLGYQNTMKAASVDKVYYQDYTAFPTWRPPTMWGSATKGYTLHLLSHKKIEFKQSRASFIPVLSEIAPKQEMLMNPTTAATLGLTEGAAVWVESHHAITNETRQVKTVVTLTDAIRPDTVSMSHHFGLTTHPSTTGQGPSPNMLFFGDEGYIQCTNDASFQVMVKVTKA